MDKKSQQKQKMKKKNTHILARAGIRARDLLHCSHLATELAERIEFSQAF